MSEDQVWAYRVRAKDPECPMERVEYLQPAPKGRCLVRFLDRDGLEECVPRRRLVVLWEEHEAWLQDELRMAAVVEVSAHADESPQYRAVSSLLGDPDLLEGVDLGYARSELCTIQIPNLQSVCAALGMEEETLRREPLSFTTKDGLFVGPWSLAVKVAMRVAELNGEAVMQKVIAEEEKIELESVHGWTYTTGRGPTREEHWVPPTRLTDFHAKQLMSLNILREWCGKEIVERLDELEALREEVRRLGMLVERAIAELRRCGQGAIAATMESDLGVPVSTLVLRRRMKKRPGG
ncbi:hypothetical protein MTP10_03595 [Nonomuraea sp. 3-1Str]|uniref:hypothetical protein n=1 Tax=Nonomuraea sp. 3-1Str TaxID=2929801 RepID=UPI0028647128|nr:hypothetical protein [Nonomuraea sp. 3-1Str]MDR8407819.1 hypothetical protein [Nonomuraea sp. 3-1Str]